MLFCFPADILPGLPPRSPGHGVSPTDYTPGAALLLSPESVLLLLKYFQFDSFSYTASFYFFSSMDFRSCLPTNRQITPASIRRGIGHQSCPVCGSFCEEFPPFSPDVPVLSGDSGLSSESAVLVFVSTTVFPSRLVLTV